MARSFAAERAEIVAGAPVMRELLAEAGRVAPFDVPVLIEGETGVGKELLARHLHRLSRRSGRPLVPVNSAAISDGLLEAEFFGHSRGAFTGAETSRAGLFEAADGGTLFLDEVGELPARAQAILLRVLQEREYRRVGETRVRKSDFRLLSATNRDLGEGFRPDLLYRLGMIRLRVPPLRERRAHIPLLAGAFARRLALRHRVVRMRFSQEALDRLEAHSWPGNARELEAVVLALLTTHAGQRVPASAVASLLRPKPAAGPDPLEGLLALRRLAEARDAFERILVLRALSRAAGNRGRAARELGITRQGLWQKLRRLRIP